MGSAANVGHPEVTRIFAAVRADLLDVTRVGVHFVQEVADGVLELRVRLTLTAGCRREAVVLVRARGQAKVVDARLAGTFSDIEVLTVDAIRFMR